MSEALRAKARVTMAEDRGGIPDPRPGVGFPTPDQRWDSRPATRGCRAFEAICLAFVAFKECLMLGFYPAERCRMSVVRYRICQYR